MKSEKNIVVLDQIIILLAHNLVFIVNYLLAYSRSWNEKGAEI